MSMFLLSLLTNKDSYNAQIIQCVNDTILKKTVPGTRFWNRFWNFRTGSYVKSLWAGQLLLQALIVNYNYN